jgi:hypothetical protein
MAKRPKNRIQNAAEVRKILEPLAQRKPIDFDFEGLLQLRAKIAEQRLATESILRGDSRSSVASRLEIGSPQLKMPTTETLARRDLGSDQQDRSPG